MKRSDLVIGTEYALAAPRVNINREYANVHKIVVVDTKPYAQGKYNYRIVRDTGGSGVLVAKSWGANWHPEVVPCGQIRMLWSDYETLNDSVRREAIESRKRRAAADETRRIRMAAIRSEVNRHGIQLADYQLRTNHMPSDVSIPIDVLERIVMLLPSETS
jgi:hypothetical protein